MADIDELRYGRCLTFLPSCAGRESDFFQIAVDPDFILLES